MSRDKSKSAIDTIYDILAKLENVESQLKNMDTNIKLLNNKVSKLSKQNAAAAPRATVPSLPELPTAKPVVVNPSEYIKVFSRIRNKRKVPIKGIDIRIYDPKGKVLKERRTDEHGYWEARIPPGEYGVEYDPSNVNKKLKVANFNIRVRSGAKEMDLSSVNH
jgi:hypothetical protein